ncbi:hypothetical protein Y032_0012g1607 [Ancylostoma ceylanicum]|uniref:Uncharacterized protein n=1 Tax=Ancylostoma ceylanicum TaxID=53326 RepID=A0A016VBB7_9BILA|nr:hypothetical protein Y032_0012g1607 [Ancylostoma ceylanicum]
MNYHHPHLTARRRWTSPSQNRKLCSYAEFRRGRAQPPLAGQTVPLTGPFVFCMVTLDTISHNIPSKFASRGYSICLTQISYSFCTKPSFL